MCLYQITVWHEFLGVSTDQYFCQTLPYMYLGMSNLGFPKEIRF